MEDKKDTKENQNLEKTYLSFISKEDLKDKSHTLLIILGVGIALWASPHVLSALAATIRSFRDFKKACKGQ